MCTIIIFHAYYTLIYIYRYIIYINNIYFLGIPLVNDSKKQVIPSKSIEKLFLNPSDSLLLQKSLHACNRYEAYINATISLNEVEINNSIELNMKSSVSFLKLSKSQVVLSHNHNNER